MDSQLNTTFEQSSGHALWKTGLLAGIISILANILVQLVTKPLAPDFTSLTATPVIFWTAIATVGATVVFALTRKYAEQPNKTFVRIAWIVLFVSFFMDIPLFFYDIEFFAGATTGGILALMAMHVVVAAIVVPVLVKFTKQVTKI